MYGILLKVTKPRSANLKVSNELRTMSSKNLPFTDPNLKISEDTQSTSNPTQTLSVLNSQKCVSVSSQCGDSLTVDEENIVVLVKSHSPLRVSEMEPSEEDSERNKDITEVDYDAQVSRLLIYRVIGIINYSPEGFSFYLAFDK